MANTFHFNTYPVVSIPIFPNGVTVSDWLSCVLHLTNKFICLFMLKMERWRQNVVRTIKSLMFIPRCDVICTHITEQRAEKWNAYLFYTIKIDQTIIWRHLSDLCKTNNCSVMLHRKLWLVHKNQTRVCSNLIYFVSMTSPIRLSSTRSWLTTNKNALRNPVVV